jgi:ribosomal protein S12 methylthiotransferase
VDGAAANALPDPVPDEVKEERRARFMQAQAAISARKLRERVGKTLQVLVDAPGVGRSSAEAPEIDGTVRFRGGKAGEFRNVVIERASAHDLHGRLA